MKTRTVLDSPSIVRVLYAWGRGVFLKRQNGIGIGLMIAGATLVVLSLAWAYSAANPPRWLGTFAYFVGGVYGGAGGAFFGLLLFSIGVAFVLLRRPSAR
jgi:hypothetical protein